MNRKNLIWLSLIAVSAVTLSACETNSMKKPLMRWKKDQQMILVLSSDWNANQGILLQFEYVNHQWTNIGQSFNVSIGKNGAAWGVGRHPLVIKGVMKTEGDMRSPAGIFQIGYSFGYADKIKSNYPYRSLTKDDYCIDNSGSPYYNQIVNKTNVHFNPSQDSTEPMRRDIHLNGDQLYKLGFVLNYNPHNIPKLGSCIFVHLRNDNISTTAGCTAMDEQNMKEILSWLNEKKAPVFVLLPIEAYQQKQKEWNLPTVRMILK